MKVMYKNKKKITRRGDAKEDDERFVYEFSFRVPKLLG